MATPLLDPATRYDPASLVDLSSQDERERLSPSALRAFFNIMARWQVRDDDARRLLGGVAPSTFYDCKRKPERVLDQDKLVRISYLIGIFKALHVLHGEELADRWIRIPNRNRIFGGRPPSSTCCGAARRPCRSCVACSMRAAAGGEGAAPNPHRSSGQPSPGPVEVPR